MRITTFIFLLICSNALAQSNYIGVRAGIISNSNISTIPGYDKQRTGYDFGLSYQHQLNKKLFIGVDLTYSQKGFKSYQEEFRLTVIGNILIQTSGDWQFNYLSLPIKLGVTLGEKFRLQLGTGIAPSILTKMIHKNETGDALSSFKLKEEIDYTNETNSFDLFGMFEFGAFVSINKFVIISPMIQYQYSFFSWTTSNILNGEPSHLHGLLFAINIKYALSK